MRPKFFVEKPYEENGELVFKTRISGLPSEQIAEAYDDFDRMAQKGFTLGRIIAFLSNFVSFFKF